MEKTTPDTKFADAFRKGVEAAANATNYHSEVQQIIEEASRQLSLASAGRLQIRFERNQLEARNPTTGNEQWTPIANVYVEDEIPSIIIHSDSFQGTCREPAEVAEALCKLLACGNVASKLQGIAALSVAEA